MLLLAQYFLVIVGLSPSNPILYLPQIRIQITFTISYDHDSLVLTYSNFHCNYPCFNKPIIKFQSHRTPFCLFKDLCNQSNLYTDLSQQLTVPILFIQAEHKEEKYKDLFYSNHSSVHNFSVHAFTPSRFAFYTFNELFESSSRIQNNTSNRCHKTRNFDFPL